MSFRAVATRSSLLVSVLCLVSLGPARAQEEPPRDSAGMPTDLPLPLEAARSIRIATDEGTWISVDISPDGQTIVFDLLGDLYTVPIAGGAARQITRGMAFDKQPRYSPDGRQILFVSDRSGGENLWVLDVASGDTTRLTRGNARTMVSPAWTPDGQYVLVSRSEGRLGMYKLWMGHVDGGSGRVLIEEPDDLKTMGAAVSPDGRYIWYAQRTGRWEYNAAFPQYQLAMYDRETGARYTRTSRYGSAFRPTLSPDGRWLVYGTRHDAQTGLRLRDLETGDERWLAYPVQRDDKETVADRDALPGMAFTPDSRELVASYEGKIWRIPVAGGTPIPVPFRVETDLPVGPEVSFEYAIDDGPAFTVREIRDPVVSPDGSQVAFTALDRLHVMAYPRGQPSRVTSGDAIEAQPGWSPDGRWLTYVTWTPDGGLLMKVRADGRGDPVQLTRRSGVYQQPAFSPDGERIVFVRGPARALQEGNGPSAAAAAADLVWIDAEGGSTRLIAPADGRSRPHFTEDADRIFLSHGGRGLLSVRWDGSDEREHLQVLGVKRPNAPRPDRASIILMAPRGDRALAQVYNDIYLVTVPYIGGETPSVSVADPERAAFPVRRLTDIGGQFPTWSADGRTAYWAIGNAFVALDLDGAGGGPAGDADTGSSAVETRIVVRGRRDTPQGDLVLRGARVITMEGDEVIEDADILVRNNRIAGVGARGTVDVPPDATVIDVTGATIVPGFVDTHAHLRTARGLHKTQLWAYLANLAYGVTTTRDPSTGTTDVLTYGDEVTAGQMLGPRIYSTGPSITGDYRVDPIEDLDHARRIVRRYSEYYQTNTIKMYMAGNRQQRQWIIMAAREQGIMPTTEGGIQLAYDLSMMIDGYPGQEHSFPLFPVYDDIVSLAVGTGITYTPTLLVNFGGPFAENYFYEREDVHDDAKLRRFTPHEEIDRRIRRRVGGGQAGGWFMEAEYVFDDHAAGARAIIEAGGRIGVGSHGQLQGLGYHWELWAVQSGGMSRHDALRAATILGAEAIGLGRELGSIVDGKLADLVILNENPLDDIRNTNTVRYVMMNGRLYEGDTLNEVWPRERMFAAEDWLIDEPAGEEEGVRR